MRAILRCHIPLVLAICFFLLYQGSTHAYAQGTMNEMGWKFLNWGMTPENVAQAMRDKGMKYAGESIKITSLWYGFDKNWNKLSLPLDEAGKSESTQNAHVFELCTSGIPDTNLLFCDKKLLGVFISKQAPQNAITYALVQMTEKYPNAEMYLGDCPDCMFFKHTTKGRIINWESDGTSFQLSFFDKNNLDKLAATLAKKTAVKQAINEVTPKDSPEHREQKNEPMSTDNTPKSIEKDTTSAPEEQTAPQQTTHNAGDTWTDPITNMEFVWIPKGCFTMGQSDAEKDELIALVGEEEYKKKYRSELPRHQACVDGFWMGKYEVTNAQFRAHQPDHDSGTQDQFPLNLPKQPVANVSANNAEAYAVWLTKQHMNKKDQLVVNPIFTLPTEAQWEYAARAGTKTSRYWGDNTSNACQYANICDQRATKTTIDTELTFACMDGFEVASPVGTYPANPWGLHDMLGNVWEWCRDAYGDYFHVMTSTNNPLNLKGYGKKRAIRGGAWTSPPTTTRSASHTGLNPTSKLKSVGFRLVMTENVGE